MLLRDILSEHYEWETSVEDSERQPKSSTVKDFLAVAIHGGTTENIPRA